MQLYGDQTWHSYSPEKIDAILEIDRTTGLTSAQVLERQQIFGPNELPKDDGFAVARAIFKQLRSPLSLVLIAAGIATIGLGEFLDSIVIFVALVINVTIGVVQEGKAARVFDALAAQQETHTTVMRSGTKQVVLSHELVPGDIVELPAGAAIPADIRLLEATNLQVNESALTGEWIPVEKQATSLGENLPVGERKNMVWMGTLVTEGLGLGVVVETGAKARFGSIAQSTQESLGSLTPLQQNIRRIARFLISIILVALVVILALGVARGEPFAEMLLLAIAVAVAAMPEGLPAAVTVVLALGMEAILKQGGLVKNLLAAETLGSTTVILTDKTGTLTEGRMVLSGFYTAAGFEQQDTTPQGDNKELLKMAVLASDAFVDTEASEEDKTAVRGRPLEKAIVEAGLQSQLSQLELFRGGNERIDFLQFESSRRYAISLNDCADKHNRLYFSGSPEHLLALSNTYYRDGKTAALDEKMRAQFINIQNELSSQGMRFTGIAYMETDSDTVPEDIKNPTGTQQYTFVGLLAFADAVRSDVAASIATAKEAGARVIMATGDYPETGRAIAYEVGIIGEKDAEVLTGTQVAGMEDDELLRALDRVKVFARVLPEQKLRIAHMLKNNGEVVAMTGDGVNDAPALAAADIGVAVGSGTEVAKASADLVLIENSFSVITGAIKEGRRVIANLRKIIAYLLSTSFSEIVVIGGALAAGAPLPLLPTQILWANIVGEGLMSFPFAFEPSDKGIMKQRPERRGVANVLTSSVRRFIFIVSLVTGAMLLLLFFFLRWLELPIEEIRTIMFVVLSIYSMFFAFSFKDLRRPIWKIELFSNRFLLVALLVSFVTLFIAVTFPPLQKLLSLSPLSMFEVGLLFVLGLINLAIVEVAKRFLGKTE